MKNDNIFSLLKESFKKPIIMSIINLNRKSFSKKGYCKSKEILYQYLEKFV